jgi:hypothetical protein
VHWWWRHQIYLFGDEYLFSILPNQQRARSDFCLISYVVNYGRVGKYNMRKSKRYISLVINIYFLFCRTNSVRDLIFV